MIETPHTMHNSCKPARRFSVSYSKVPTNRYKGVKPAAKSGEPFNVVHMSSTIAASVTTAIMFGSRGSYRKKDLPLPVGGKMVKVFITKQIQGGNIKALRPHSN